MFGVKKTRTMWLVDVQKKLDDMCSRFDTIPACDGQTDRRTNKHLATAWSRAIRNIARQKLLA